MYYRLLIAITLLLCKGCSARFWDYEPISIETFSSDEAKANLVAHFDRSGKDYAQTATLTIEFDMDETTMIEMTVYHSSSGKEADYKQLSVQKQTFEKFSKNFYEKLIYIHLHPCSNIPEPENVYPFPRGIYNFNKCTANGNGMPDIVPQGYYKIICAISGEVDIGFIVIAKVTTKIDLLG